MSIEREVKKASRDLTHEISVHENPLTRIEAIHKKYTKLYGDMKRLERDHQKAKKRGDQLQKEKDAAKSELTKMNSLKEKLEKLSRETNNENRKLRVSFLLQSILWTIALTCMIRPMCSVSRKLSPRCELNYMNDLSKW